MQDRQAGATGWSVSLLNGRAEYARIPKPILILASRFIGAAESDRQKYEYFVSTGLLRIFKRDRIYFCPALTQITPVTLTYNPGDTKHDQHCGNDAF